MIKSGKHTHVPEDISCYEGVNLTIGNFCSIGSGFKIYSGTHACIEHPEVVSTFAFAEVWNADYPKGEPNGEVTIGNDVWIATDVRILTGVRIGDGAIIGAGSVVTKDVLPYALVAGNPAEFRRWRIPARTIDQMQKISWWNWSDEEIKKAMPYMKDVDKFVEKYENNTTNNNI